MTEFMDKVRRFFASPLNSNYAVPFRDWGDWLTLAGIILFSISVFALNWIRVGVKVPLVKEASEGFGLFESPWAWVTVAVFVLVLIGLWFVQTRGLVAFIAGLYCIAFSVVFYIGAWLKIRSIIGDVMELIRGVPFVGYLLEDLAAELIDKYLSINVDIGYWLFIPAGLLIAAGGFVRFYNSGGLNMFKKKHAPLDGAS